MNDQATAAVALVDDGSDTMVRVVAQGYLAAYGGHTLRGYMTDLRLWFDWCEQFRVPIMEARRSHIETYARAMEEAGRQPATVYRRLVTIAGFYRYAEQEDFLARSPAAYVRRPRVSQESNSLWLDRHEAVRFLEHSSRVGGYDYALASLLLLNGLRVSEACGATIEALSFEDGHHTLAIMGKGRKPSKVPLAPRTLRAVLAGTGERAAGPLLFNRDGEPMSRHNAARTVRRLCRGADVKVVGPHALRHSFITLSLDAGVSLRDVQNSARHANTATTVRYDRNRQNLDRHATHILSAFLGSA